MEQAVVERYLSEVPYEARAAVMGLSNDLRWAVYTALVLGGRKYFNEIKGEFKANPNTIGPVLKDLVDSGLVARKIAKFEDFADKRKVFYEPTGLGLRLFEMLGDVAVPGRRVSREPRAGVEAASTSDVDARKNTGTGDRYARQPDTPALRCGGDVCRRWKPARAIRNRSARKRGAKQPGLA